MASADLSRRLFEAFSAGRGCRLSHGDVVSLFRDEAFACAVSNAAAQEAGVDEVGADEASRAKGKTWRQFKQELVRQAKGGDECAS